MDHMLEEINPMWEAQLRRATDQYVSKRIVEGASSSDIVAELQAMADVCTLKVYGATHGKT